MGAKHHEPNRYAFTEDDEQALNLHVDWTKEEESKAKRK